MKITEKKDLTIKRCGLTIDPIYDEFACSPDGLVYLNSDIEL